MTRVHGFPTSKALSKKQKYKITTLNKSHIKALTMNHDLSISITLSEDQKYKQL